MNEEFEKMRAVFDAWASENYYDITRLKSEYDNYKSHVTTSAWQVWQASRKQALEEFQPDAERFRYLRERYAGFDFDWMPSSPDARDGKSVAVFDMGRDFRFSRDITSDIDDAILALQKE